MYNNVLFTCFNWKKCVFYSSKVPAFLNVVDIAGLVKGAHEGQGLGNAFLSHIKACDALFHMSSKFTLILYGFKEISDWIKYH